MRLYGPANVCRPGIRGQEAQDKAGDIPGSDGRSDSLAKSSGPYPALLPHGWKGETALSAGGHAAGPLRAALLQQ